jgi:hypothetical protein
MLPIWDASPGETSMNDMRAPSSLLFLLSHPINLHGQRAETHTGGSRDFFVDQPDDRAKDNKAMSVGRLLENSEE